MRSHIYFREFEEMSPVFFFWLFNKYTLTENIVNWFHWLYHEPVCLWWYVQGSCQRDAVQIFAQLANFLDQSSQAGNNHLEIWVLNNRQQLLPSLESKINIYISLY